MQHGQVLHLTRIGCQQLSGLRHRSVPLLFFMSDLKLLVMGGTGSSLPSSSEIFPPIFISLTLADKTYKISNVTVQKGKDCISEWCI